MNKSMALPSTASENNTSSLRIERVHRRHLTQAAQAEKSDIGSLKVHRINRIGAATSAIQRQPQQLVSNKSAKSAVTIRYVSANKSLMSNSGALNVDAMQPSVLFHNSDIDTNQSMTSFTTRINNSMPYVSFVVSVHAKIYFTFKF